MTRPFRIVLSLIAAVVLLTPAARAVEPDEILPDARLEERARAISADLRCLVCQNQSIDDSNAPLAKDLRLLVRERLKAGDSDQQVHDYVVARYGDFVLLRPPFRLSTLLLWVTPLLALGLAAFAVRRMFSAQATAGGGAPAAASRLSPDEEQALARLLAEKPKD